MKNKSQTLFSLLCESTQLCYTTGIEKLDQALQGSHGLHKGGIYDINCVPGMSSVWSLIFKIMFSFLGDKADEMGRDDIKENTSTIGVPIEITNNEPPYKENDTDTDNTFERRKKILVLQSLDKIPWSQFKANKQYLPEYSSRIDVLQIQTLVELIIVLQDLDFSNYGLILIDRFHELYQQSQLHVRMAVNGGNDLVSFDNDGSGNGDMYVPHSHSKRGVKRDIIGQPVMDPVKKLKMVLQEIMVILNSIADKHDLVIITSGKLEPHTQRIPEDQLEDLDGGSDDDDESENPNGKKKNERYFIQRILVPVVSLMEPASNQFTNRIILFKDWLLNDPSSFGSVSSGLEKGRDINGYIRLIEGNNLKCAPHFLCTSSGAPSSSGSTVAGNGFTSGWFQVNDVTGDIIDSEKNLKNEVHENMNSTDQFDENTTSLLEDTSATFEKPEQYKIDDNDFLPKDLLNDSSLIASGKNSENISDSSLLSVITTTRPHSTGKRATTYPTRTKKKRSTSTQSQIQIFSQSQNVSAVQRPSTRASSPPSSNSSRNPTSRGTSPNVSISSLFKNGKFQIPSSQSLPEDKDFIPESQC
ncbi:unnamed protein product [Ambrosiozyma monospora]|uniref:Unnamed protein product n=1 Tax=Ambrosiozyma monospora TaxID=43982 RepID=A0ACB5T1I3_AMBMO|nr:unnamed protein product [Ambrosiozyma monospora]